MVRVQFGSWFFFEVFSQLSLIFLQFYPISPKSLKFLLPFFHDFPPVCHPSPPRNSPSSVIIHSNYHYHLATFFSFLFFSRSPPPWHLLLLLFVYPFLLSYVPPPLPFLFPHFSSLFSSYSLFSRFVFPLPIPTPTPPLNLFFWSPYSRFNHENSVVAIAM